MLQRLWFPIALGICASLGAAQGVGTKVGAIELVDYAQTEAKSFDDFLGRTVLIEFFAHW